MVCRCKGKEEKLLYLPFIFLSWSFLLSHRWFFFLHLCFQCLTSPFRFFFLFLPSISFIQASQWWIMRSVAWCCVPQVPKYSEEILTALQLHCKIFQQPWLPWLKGVHRINGCTSNGGEHPTLNCWHTVDPYNNIFSGQKSPRLWDLIQWEMEMLPRNSGNYTGVIFITYLEQSGFLFCVSWITPQF